MTPPRPEGDDQRAQPVSCSMQAALPRAATAGAAVLACALSCVLASGAAQAQSSNASASTNAAAAAAPDDKNLPLWEVGMGLGALRLPHYRGSDQYRAWVLPLPYVAYRGDIFKADRDGARAEFLKANDWRFDFSVAAGAPTNSKDNTTRQGMRDLAPTLEFGPSFIWTAARGAGWKLETRVPLRGAMTLERSPRFVGAVLTPNLNLDVIVGGWDVGFYIGPVFGTRSQNGYYYDVPDADVLPGRPAYRSGAGYAGSQFVFGTSRRFGDWWVGAFGKIDQLNGAVFDDSPIVKRKTNAAFGIGVSWIFWKSPRPAPDAAR